MIAEKILKGLESAGLQGRILPVSRLGQVQSDIESLLEAGLLDRAFYEENLRRFKYAAPEGMPQAQSLVVIDVPQPQFRLHFHFEGRDVPVLLPPTYADPYGIDARVKGVLERSVASDQCRFAKAILPYKTIATRTGLAKYGRNNITYVPRYGSFHRLTGFFTDADLGTDHWQEREMLPRCAKCRACLEACPTGAIAEDRFLIKAETCLTNLNEAPAERQFPSYVRSTAHHSIVGCIKCQRACPYDSELLGWCEEGERFSEEDTAYLLKGGFGGREAEEMEKRLGKWGLDLSIFPRNLQVLLEQ